MEQTKGLLRTFLKQWGALNTVRIFLKTGSKTGHIQAIKSILSFRPEKLTLELPRLPLGGVRRPRGDHLRVEALFLFGPQNQGLRWAMRFSHSD